MEQRVENKINQYNSAHGRKKRWHKIVTALAAVVVFCTTYALIMPAVTLQETTYCGYEEHPEHTDECYAQIKTLTCELSEAGHAHCDECYETQRVIICGMEETEGHTHDDSCYRCEEVCICTSEDPEHVHDASCFTTQRELICTTAERLSHHHTEECYKTQKTLVCGLEEQASHVHTEECWETAPDKDHLICELEVHAHTLQCFSDPEADVESREVWESTFKDIELTGECRQDVMAIAVSQLGYSESTRNYEVQPDGKSRKGYSRYGAWYGIPYGDWCAMFCSFCLHYAEVDPEELPPDANCPHWIEQLDELARYRAAEEWTPEPGDLIFFDYDGDRSADHVGFVYEVTEDTLRTLEGNKSNCVKLDSYEPDDTCILGYGILELPEEEEAPAPVRAPMMLFGSSASADAEITGQSVQLNLDGTLQQISGTYYISIDPAQVLEQNISLSCPYLVVRPPVEIENFDLNRSLFYSAAGADGNGVYADAVPVSYLRLNRSEAGYELVPYSADGTELTGGELLVVGSEENTHSAQISLTAIQTTSDLNGLYSFSYLSEEDAYTFTYFGEPGDVFDLSRFTSATKFFYEDADNDAVNDDGSRDPGSLHACTQVMMVEEDGEYILLPLDANGEPVPDTRVYMVYDELYRFVITVNNMVNEHSEDNGDVMLWKGIAYHNTKADSEGAAGGKDKRIWVLNQTKQANADKTLTAVRKQEYVITGRLGERFTPAEAGIGTILYAAQEDAAYADAVGKTTEGNYYFHTNWNNVGNHASDGGTRYSFYLITDYIRLNSYRDKISFFEVYEKADGTVSLRARHYNGNYYDVTTLRTTNTNYMGKSDKIYGYTNTGYSNLDLYTTRGAVVRPLFDKDNTGTPSHVQLRVENNVTLAIGDKIYQGNFLFDYGKVRATYTNNDGGTFDLYDDNGSPYKIMKAKPASSGGYMQESEYFTFNVNKGPKKNLTAALDASRMVIWVEYHLYGTLTNIDDPTDTLVYTKGSGTDFVYTMTLSSEQLRQAYYSCPLQRGYDVILDLNQLSRLDYEHTDSVQLIKVWEDNQNIRGYRPGEVTVSLERSVDGETWETFENNTAVIEGKTIDNIWYAQVDGLEQHRKPDDTWEPYRYRILEGSEQWTLIGSAQGMEYSSKTSGTTVTNTLVPSTTELYGEKIWEDQEGTVITDEITESITVILMQKRSADGIPLFYDSVEVSPDTDWLFGFENLPEYYQDDSGVEHPFYYEVAEYHDSEYDSTVEVLDDGTILITNVRKDVSYELPETGGIGTLPIYTFGGLLMMSALMYGFGMRRKRERRSER